MGVDDFVKLANENKVAKVEKNEITNINPNFRWDEKLELVRNMVAKNCSKDEFELLVYTAKLYNLNPLKREIYTIKYSYNSPAVPVVSRDGLLAIAHSTRTKNGEPAFDGIETTYNENDKSATCVVYRKDMNHPIKCTVYLEEFAGTNNPLWKSKPRVMLMKVAESFALRRAFNINGVYIQEEFDKEIERGDNDGQSSN